MSAGRRPRVGLIVPSTQVVTEPLFNRAKGNSWDFVVARVLLRGAGVHDLEEMESRIPRAVEELSTARVDAIVSCCTASGAINGLRRDEQACSDMATAAHARATSTMLSIVANLRHLGATRLVVVTPYQQELARTEHQYLTDNGFSVVASHDGDIGDPFAMSEASEGDILEAAMAAWTDTADAMLLSCMNWPTYEAAPVIRDRIGAPVVTSHSATLWNVERLLSGA